MPCMFVKLYGKLGFLHIKYFNIIFDKTYGLVYTTTFRYMCYYNKSSAVADMGDRLTTIDMKASTDMFQAPASG